MSDDSSPKREESNESVPDTSARDDSGRVDLSGGGRGIVVVPTQSLAPIGPDDFPSGLPAVENVVPVQDPVAPPDSQDLSPEAAPSNDGE